jgi:hypothetical protein
MKQMKIGSKKQVRPATGRDPLVGFRASPETRASIVRWAENQPDLPTLSEAIRRLVEQGLTMPGRRTQTSPGRAQRATELAGNVIDELTAVGSDAQESASRKRRLLKGPEEYRDVRIDRTKANEK